MVNGSQQAPTPAESLMSRVLEQVKGTANVEVVYGEPRVIGQKTIIPIAVVAYGFGAGAGAGHTPSPDGEVISSGSGGGGGGGVRVQPIGVLEVTEARTRVVPVLDWTAIIKAVLPVALSLVAGRLLARVLRR